MCEEDKSKKCKDCSNDCSCDAEIEQDSTKTTGRGCESPTLSY